MPVSGYYRGKGDRVMADMIRRYGKKKGERVFYATANAKDQNPKAQLASTDAQSDHGYGLIGPIQRGRARAVNRDVRDYYRRMTRAGKRRSSPWYSAQNRLS